MTYVPWVHHTHGFMVLKIFCAPPVCLSPASPWHPWYFNYLLVLAFLWCHRVGMIQNVTFSGWFLSLSDRHLSFLVFSLAPRLSFEMINLVMSSPSLKYHPCCSGHLTWKSNLSTLGCPYLCTWTPLLPPSAPLAVLHALSHVLTQAMFLPLHLLCCLLCWG